MNGKPVAIFCVFAFSLLSVTLFNTIPHYLNKSSVDFQKSEGNTRNFTTGEDKKMLSNNWNQSRGTCSEFSEIVNEQDSHLKFVFFFGFSRCGSTATSMILDAHPNAMVANEFDLFGKMQKGRGIREVLSKICKVSEATRARNFLYKGYSFDMGEGHGLYQGNLKLIGFRKSRATTKLFQENFTGFQRNYARLAEKFTMFGILVTRNVYDMIATRLGLAQNNPLLRVTLDTGNTVYVDRKNVSSIGYHGRLYKFCHFGFSNGTVKIVTNSHNFYLILDFFREIAELSKEMVRLLKFPNLIVRLDEMIANPRPVVQELCAFFDLECFPSYVDQAIQGLYTEPNPTRRGIEWKKEHIEAVEEMKKDFPDYFFGSHLVE